MIGVVATLKAKEGRGSELEAVFKTLAEQVRANESGCHLYQLTKSRTEPDTYKVMELYADQDALSHHGGTDYFKSIGAQMGPLLAGRPQVEYLDAV